MVFKSILVIILDGFQHVFRVSLCTILDIRQNGDFHNAYLSLFDDVLSAFLNTVWHCINLVEGN